MLSSNEPPHSRIMVRWPNLPCFGFIVFCSAFCFCINAFFDVVITIILSVCNAQLLPRRHDNENRNNDGVMPAPNNYFIGQCSVYLCVYRLDY